ncbi:MAG: hypothetical protein WC699_10060 [Bacteroidales bacterium]
MKTLKTKLLPGFLFLLAFLPLLVTSCTEDVPDLRDEIIGQYSYTVEINQQVGNDLVYIGDQGDNYDIKGTMRVTKNTGSLDVLDFYDGNVLMFHGTDVKDAGNAIVFDIPDQEAYIGPTKVLIAGYPYWNVDQSTYDGAFLYEDSSVEIAFTARIQNAETGLVMVLTAFR